jgi:hypothetical protein
MSEAIQPKERSLFDDYDIIEVTTTELYLVYKSDSRSHQEVVDEWFVKYASGSHATRDGSVIGGSRKLVSFRDVDQEELKKKRAKTN